MRVDPYYVVNLVQSLDQTQASEQQLTEELSTGVSLTTIGENPVAAGQNVSLLNEINQDDSFTQTANATQGQLQVTDSALGSVVSELTQAISLATEGNNSTENASNLKSISSQLASIRDEVVSLANTSYQGQYVFAGSQTTTAPFTLDESTSPATVTYNGDSEVNYLQTPNGQSIQLNVPGNQIFTSSTANVLGTLNSLIADFSSGTASSTSVADTASLSAALNYVSDQRVTLDDSITRLSDASGQVTSQQTQLTAAQTTLIQADLGSVSTDLSLAKTQESAIISVISTLGSGSLFDKL